MIKNLRKRCTKNIVIFSVFVFVMTGLSCCGRKKVIYNDNSTPSDIVGPMLKEKIGAEDYWEEEIGQTQNKMNKSFIIQADVIIPEVESLKVIEVEDLEYSEEEKRKAIENLGADSVRFYDEEGYQDIPLDKMSDNSYYKADAFTLVDGDIQKSVCFSQDEWLGYYFISYNADLLNGKYSASDGTEYTGITCGKSSESYDTEDNKCKLSKQDIQKIADDFMAKLGLEGEYTITNIYALEILGLQQFDFYWDGNYENWPEGMTSYITYDDTGESYGIKEEKINLNGAYVELERVIDGVSVDWGEYSDSYDVYETEEKKENFKEKEDPHPYLRDNNEHIYICINEEGVLEFQYRRPTKTVTVKAEDVKILNFSQIKDCYRTAMEKLSVSAINKNYLYLKKMELKYYKVPDPDNLGRYSIIPVWKLGSDDSLWIFLNAIDGSYIQVNPEEAY